MHSVIVAIHVRINELQFGKQINRPDFALTLQLTHYSGRVTQICVFNTVKLGTSASSP